MNKKQTLIQNKRKFKPNRAATIIALSLAAFIFGPVISLFLVFGVTIYTKFTFRVEWINHYYSIQHDC